jgi:hypothetical protein
MRENPSPQLRGGYYLEKDSDILILRRADGTEVAAFSAQGASREAIEGAVEEDYDASDEQQCCLEKMKLYSKVTSRCMNPLQRLRSSLTTLR